MKKSIIFGFSIYILSINFLHADYNYTDQPNQYSNYPQPLNANYQYYNTTPQNSYQYSSTDPNLYLNQQQTYDDRPNQRYNTNPQNSYQYTSTDPNLYLNQQQTYDDRPNQWYSDRHYNYGSSAAPFMKGQFVETNIEYGTSPLDNSATSQTRVYETPSTTIQYGTRNTPPTQTELANSGIELANSIRKALQADKSLSSGARNVQVGVDSNGNVTLKGNVSSDAEKNKVEAIARSASGMKTINNKLTILKK